MRLFEGTPWDRPPVCERCQQLESACQCPPAPAPLIPPGKQTARLAVEKRSKGKVVTVIRGLPTVGNDLPALLKDLKNHCGAGGTLQAESIEIQGDHLARIRDFLKQQGYKVKG